MLTTVQGMKQAIQQVRKCQSWLQAVGRFEEVVEVLDKVVDDIEKRIKKEAA